MPRPDDHTDPILIMGYPSNGKLLVDVSELAGAVTEIDERRADLGLIPMTARELLYMIMEKGDGIDAERSG